MLGGVAGRHMSTRRRGSSPLVRLGGDPAAPEGWPPAPPHSPASPRYRRRRAVTTSDFKSCALVQTRVKLGDIIIRFQDIPCLVLCPTLAERQEVVYYIPSFASTQPHVIQKCREV
ncbi:Uncharacterized protein GBIM_15680 [Gryllus bimaculatus]|nr:Uncharacterized protein GBIM_15680 [Gryllus bimaculatus]